MKGIIFVELIKMAEDAFGERVVDNVLEQAKLINGGAYTTVGNYPCSELIKIVTAFSEHSGISPELLQRKFGGWMMQHFSANYPTFFADKTNAFEMLESVDQEIHVEVKKLYPDADLPQFITNRLDDRHLSMTYISPRPLVEFCHGLIESCVSHFGQTAEIEQAQVAALENATVFDIHLKGE